MIIPNLKGKVWLHQNEELETEIHYMLLSNVIKLRKLDIIKYQNYKFLNNCLAVSIIMRNFAPEINGW